MKPQAYFLSPKLSVGSVVQGVSSCERKGHPLIEVGTRALHDGTFHLQVWQICTSIFNQFGWVNISRLPEHADENGFKA